MGCFALLDPVLVNFIRLLQGVDGQSLHIHDAHHSSLRVLPQVELRFALIDFLRVRSQQVVELVEIKLDHIAFENHRV